MTKTDEPRDERGQLLPEQPAPGVCGFVTGTRDKAGGGTERRICAAPAKNSAIGPRCADHYPAVVRS